MESGGPSALSRAKMFWLLWLPPNASRRKIRPRPFRRPGDPRLGGRFRHRADLSRVRTRRLMATAGAFQGGREKCQFTSAEPPEARGTFAPVKVSPQRDRPPRR